jgi:N-acetylneuraminic acid mutarotase
MSRESFVKHKFPLLLILLLLLGACRIRTDSTPLPETELGEWQQHAFMPAPRSEMPAAGLDGYIYVPGGFGGEAVFEAYHPESDAWNTLENLPEGRHHLMATAHDGRIYIFGGARSVIDWRATDTAWAYDPLTDSWTELEPMPEARVAGAAVSLGDYIYVIGGTGGSKDLLRYDPGA